MHGTVADINPYFMSVDYVAGHVGIKPYEVLMTSEERHEARYSRRKAVRDARKEELNRLYGDYDETISFKTLHDTYYKCRSGTCWKGSVQKYGIDIMRNTLKSHTMLVNGEDTFKGFYSFKVYERGKVRNIRSVHISERCIQKAMCQTSIVPMLTNSFIYDNGASQKGKGTAFAVDRLTEYLHKYYRHYGDNEGYVIKGDFKKYFDSIDHDEVIKIVDKAFTDKRFVNYVEQAISHYGPIGLGLGSEENQILAMALPNKFDQWIKTVKRIREYVRYCDDFVIIVRTKEEATAILAEAKEILDDIKIRLHESKTQIIKLSHGFTFLKIKFSLTNTGKVIRRTSREKITRERHRLRSFKKMVDRGEVDSLFVRALYKAWRGQFFIKTSAIKYRHFNVCNTVKSIDEYYISLFGKEKEYVYSR